MFGKISLRHNAGTCRPPTVKLKRNKRRIRQRYQMIQNIRAVKLVKFVDMVMKTRTDSIFLSIFTELIEPFSNFFHRFHIREIIMRTNDILDAKLRKKRKFRSDSAKLHVSGPRCKPQRIQKFFKLRCRHPAVVPCKFHAGIPRFGGMTQFLLKRKLRSGIRIKLYPDLFHGITCHQSK